MNYIFMASDNFDLNLYADDTNFFRHVWTLSPPTDIKKTVDGLVMTKNNYEIKNIWEWLTIEKLTLNVMGNKYMLFHCNKEYK